MPQPPGAGSAPIVAGLRHGHVGNRPLWVLLGGRAGASGCVMITTVRRTAAVDAHRAAVAP